MTNLPFIDEYVNERSLNYTNFQLCSCSKYISWSQKGTTARKRSLSSKSFNFKALMSKSSTNPTKRLQSNAVKKKLKPSQSFSKPAMQSLAKSKMNTGSGKPKSKLANKNSFWSGKRAGVGDRKSKRKSTWFFFFDFQLFEFFRIRIFSKIIFFEEFSNFEKIVIRR